MKKGILNLKISILLASAAVLCGSCIKENFPTNAVTQDQVDKNPNSMEYLVNGMNVWLGQAFTMDDDRFHYDFGYPGLCIAMDRMGQDLVDPNNDNYDQFSSWSQIAYLDADRYQSYFFWNFYYTLVAKANIVLKTADPESPDFIEDWYPAIGQAKFYRAFAYFNLVQLYQWTYLNDKTLPAVPILDEKSGEAEASNAPRASVEKVYEFILADMADAWKYLDADDYGYERSAINLVDQQVVAGLYARIYLTMGGEENWQQAAAYAKMAQRGFTPLIEQQFNNPVNGFNDILSQNSWIWAIDLTLDDDAVKTGIINFTSFMCNIYEMGYSSVGVNAIIDAALYDEMGENDFRRNTWDSESYLSNKFAPYMGDPQSELQACDFPLMRVEEMMLIEAEAEGMLDAAKGAQLLTAFGQLRDPDYTCTASTPEDVREAVWIQRRLELWGEGFSLFDIKRLQKGVTRLYEGSNHPDLYKWNFTVTPGYMNFCIPRSEIQNNDGISQEQNNPTPKQPTPGATYDTPYI